MLADHCVGFLLYLPADLGDIDSRDQHDIHCILFHLQNLSQIPFIKPFLDPDKGPFLELAPLLNFLSKQSLILPLPQFLDLLAQVNIIESIKGLSDVGFRKGLNENFAWVAPF